MEEGQQEDSGMYAADPLWKIREIEEKQRILNSRTILIGENLVELKEKNTEEFLEIKKQLEILKQGMERVRVFLEMASKEFPKYAKKQDLEILKKQAKMFQI